MITDNDVMMDKANMARARGGRYAHRCACEFAVIFMPLIFRFIYAGCRRYYCFRRFFAAAARHLMVDDAAMLVATPLY